MEGQFDNDKLSGFGRRVNSNGSSQIGWHKEGYFHGYAKIIYSDNALKEGLWEKNEFRRNPEDIKEYDAENGLIAQPVRWDDYITKVGEEYLEEVEKEAIEGIYEKFDAINESQS